MVQWSPVYRAGCLSLYLNLSPCAAAVRSPNISQYVSCFHFSLIVKLSGCRTTMLEGGWSNLAVVPIANNADLVVENEFGDVEDLRYIPQV